MKQLTRALLLIFSVTANAQDGTYIPNVIAEPGITVPVKGRVTAVDTQWTLKPFKAREDAPLMRIYSETQAAAEAAGTQRSIYVYHRPGTDQAVDYIVHAESGDGVERRKIISAEGVSYCLKYESLDKTTDSSDCMSMSEKKCIEITQAIDKFVDAMGSGDAAKKCAEAMGPFMNALNFTPITSHTRIMSNISKKLSTHINATGAGYRPIANIKIDPKASPFQAIQQRASEFLSARASTGAVSIANDCSAVFKLATFKSPARNTGANDAARKSRQ